ncbi:hypothetical protein DVH24_030608 [Malus domestica]|uniref:Uncharacterized protein n=1 Tax=Malus domestica TaxID=3750 RepID=A0A498JYR5_MALDO|nr:hypothetical protein DVH24_030608 [Malus domestica]
MERIHKVQDGGMHAIDGQYKSTTRVEDKYLSNIVKRCSRFFGNGYRTDGQTGEESMKKAANFTCEPCWKLNNFSSLAAFLEYLKEKGDMKVIQKILTIIEQKGHLPTSLCSSL